MKKELIFNGILLVVTLSFTLTGCDSSHDDTKDGATQERTKIIMPTANGDIDWNMAKLVWSEDFNDPASFVDKWVFENRADPNVADQLQKYNQANAEVNGGTLKIYAKKVGAGQNKGDYTSSRISGKYSFQYGRIEVSAKLPEGEKPGIWAQIALLGDNMNIVGWPESGEIDVMEYFSYKPNKTFITAHSAANNNGYLISANTDLETAEEEFHAYGILWTSNYIKFYIDDPENIIYVLDRPSNATVLNWPFDQPFYLLVGMAVGGRHAGPDGVDDSMFPAVMEIEYIRVYHAL